MIIDSFSKRNKKPCQKLIYDKIPLSFKNQLCHIAADYLNEEIFNVINEELCREHGWIELPGTTNYSFFRQYKSLQKIQIYLEQEKDVNKILDVVERVLFYSQIILINKNKGESEEKYNQENNFLINEINNRFKQNCLGYIYLGKECRVIREDQIYLTKKTTLPAFDFLKKYKAPKDYFKEAHVFFRKKDNENAIISALKTLESFMKIICDKYNFSYNEKNPVLILFDILIKNKFIPDYLKKSLHVSSVRNKAAHGHKQKIVFPDYIVSYILYAVANIIILLFEADKKNKNLL